MCVGGWGGGFIIKFLNKKMYGALSGRSLGDLYLGVQLKAQIHTIDISKDLCQEVSLYFFYEGSLLERSQFFL